MGQNIHSLETHKAGGSMSISLLNILQIMCATKLVEIQNYHNHSTSELMNGPLWMPKSPEVLKFVSKIT